MDARAENVCLSGSAFVSLCADNHLRLYHNARISALLLIY